MKKILELEYPIIRSYPHHANLIAGIMTNDFDFDEIAPHYIQIVYNNNINRSDFNYGMDILSYIKNYPYVDSYCYDRNIIKKKWKNYSNFVIDMIDRECYVHMLIDTYYVPLYKEWYNKFHQLHNIMIYGYDDSFFYVADCFENGIYSFEKMCKDNINKAELSNESYDWLDGIHCWHIKEKMYLCIGIDTCLTKKMLRDYIKHKKTEAFTKIESLRRGRYGEPFYYGLDVYRAIANYVKRATGYLDIRIPYIILEQKKVLKYICNKLESQYKLVDYKSNMTNLEILEKEIIIIQSWFIKYNITGDIRIKDILISKIDEVKSKEEILIKKLYDDIKIKSLFMKPVLIRTGYIKYSFDNVTQGEWKKKYGKNGYYIIGDKIYLGEGIKIYTNNAYYVSVLRNSADNRGLIRVNNDSNRLCAYYLNHIEFNIEIQVVQNRNISLHFVDYDRLNRVQKIVVQSKKTGSSLVECVIKEFESGIYMVFDVNEDIIISIKCVEGPDAVLSGIFFN